jgi:hypothetical protein
MVAISREGRGFGHAKKVLVEERCFSAASDPTGTRALAPEALVEASIKVGHRSLHFAAATD